MRDWRDGMTRLGFDLARLRFAARTALACGAAVLVAWLLGLEHPQWSGMTVWIAAQPVRSHLLEKSFFRIAGTLSGTAVGVALVVLARQDIGLLVLGLAVWISLCAGIGNVQRGFVSYGTLLAGYSAALVSLLGKAHPERIWAFGADRLLTVLLGVGMAVLTGWFFTQASPPHSASVQARRLAARVLAGLAGRLRGQPDAGNPDVHALLADIAALDEQLDPTSAPRTRQTARAVRALLSAQVAALLWMQDQSTPGPDAALADTLEAAAHALQTGASADALPDAAALPPVVSRIATALRALDGLADNPALPPQPTPSTHLVVLHRDWIGAREALVRSGSAILIVGLLWRLTGWEVLAFMMLGTAVMTTLFSTFDNPTVTLRTVFVGQLMGVAGALACRWLVWPHATSEGQLIAWLMPFIALGALVYAHRRTMGGSFDYNMVTLLLLQPSYPLSGTVWQSLAGGAAVLSAPVLAWAAFRLIYPASAQRRLNTLIRMMVHELQDMAADPQALRHQPVWQARLMHRLLRLVRWVEKTGGHHSTAVDGSLAVLELGRTLLQAQALLDQPALPPSLARCLRSLLQRLHRIGQQPEHALRALERATRRLSRHQLAEAAGFAAAQRHLAGNLEFFRLERPD